MLLFVFLSVIYSKLYVENFTLKVMPNATVLRNFSTKLPITYFLANFKFRYWNNKVPIMLGGATFEPDYYFESISRDQYLALKALYEDILFMEYVIDYSIPPEERLKIYKILGVIYYSRWIIKLNTFLFILLLYPLSLGCSCFSDVTF